MIFELSSVNGKDNIIMQQSDLIHILYPRAQEVLCMVHDEIITHNLQSFIPTGLVLTGGGSLLRGVKELAEKIFNVPVRIGSPRLLYSMPESLDHPMYATGYGLLIHTARKAQRVTIDSMSGPLVNRVLTRMKSWVSDFF